MSPPIWVDEQGRPRPTRPCLRCQREIPVNRWPVKTLPTTKRWPYQVIIFVDWCGHQQEVVFVPDGDGWYSEIPVLGESNCAATQASLARPSVVVYSAGRA